MEYSVEPLSPEANEAALTAIKADPGQWFSKLLPRRLAEDGGPVHQTETVNCEASC